VHLERNRILAALPDEERELIARRLELCSHSVRETVYRQGERIASVIFPLSGVFSLIVESDGAAPVEVATVGSEGFVGLPVFLQATLTGAHMAFSQVEGDVVNATPGLRTALQRYSMALMTQIARGAACNRQHDAEQRASRWILQTHDRVDADRFTLAASFLAQMLGEDPETVTAVTARLAERGLVAYDGEDLTVLDRAGIERAACDCYALVRAEYDRLL
jgi:CRP-like cAMP-binding protein